MKSFGRNTKPKMPDLLEKPAGCIYPPETIKDITISNKLRERCMLGDKDACKEYYRACLGFDYD